MAVLVPHVSAPEQKSTVSVSSVRKSIKRYKSESESGLEDRYSFPRTSPTETPSEKMKEIFNMRKEGEMTDDHIA